MSTLATALALAPLAASPSPPAGTVLEGPHFRVVLDFEDLRVAGSALAAVELAWTAGEEHHDLPRSLDELLPVHLYRTIEAYEKADGEIAGGRFTENLAFTWYEPLGAHVALQPPLSDEALAKLGLPLQTMRLLAHQAAHLLRSAAMPNYGTQPGWIVDGGASWIDRRALMEIGLVPEERAEDPYAATEVVHVLDALEAGELPSLAELLADETDGLPFYRRHAARSLTFEFLNERKHRKKLDRVLAEARRLGGGPEHTAAVTAFAHDTFGGEKKLAAMDADFREWLQELEPAWEEVFRSLGTGGEAWPQIAFPSRNAIAWRTVPPGKVPYVIEGELRVLPGEGTQLNVLLDRADDGFVSVAFAAGSGVTVFRYHSADDRWERLAFAEQELPLGERIPFVVRAARGGELEIEASRESLLEVTVPGRDLAGPWGLSAQAGSAGVWYGVEQGRR